MDVNAVNDQITALMYAAGNGHLDVIHLLLEYGAAVDAKDAPGQTALTWAAHEKQFAVVEALRAAGASIGILEAGMLGDTETILRLIDQGVDVNTARPHGDTALVWAADRGHVEAIQTLIAHSANLEASDEFGTALYRAAARDYVEIVRILLEAGANPNSETVSGPILVIAAWDGHTEIVRLLLDFGANRDAQDINRCTALEAAEERGHTKIVHLLKQAGATE